MTEPVFTRDKFLGGRVVADQPKKGFRAGHDTVLLAAAIPAVSGDTVLELGAGVGIASLCIAARVAGISIRGIEIDPDLAEVANANAALNSMADRVRFEAADIGTYNPASRFTHVSFNPPFHPETGRGSPDASKERAKRGGDDLIASWTRIALGLAMGTITAIVRADRLDEILTEAKGRSATVLPILPRVGETAKRAIVHIDLAKTGVQRVLPALVLHEADGKNTETAEAILRHGKPITQLSSP